MGSISYRSSKADAIRSEIAERADFIIKSRVIGSSVWYLGRGKQQDGTEVKYVGLLRIEAEDGLVWVKSLDESVGPYYFNCPVSFLDQASEPVGYAIEWREKVRKFAANAKAKKAALKPGCQVTYGGTNYRLVRSLGTRGWMVNSGGFDCRMNSSQVRDAKVVA